MMRILDKRDAEEWVLQTTRRKLRFEAQQRVAERIVHEVRSRGDAALREYARQFDKLGDNSLRVSAAEMSRARRSVPPELMSHVKRASENIRRFAQRQRPTARSRTRDGITLGQLVIPLDSVACYVPGGRYPLLSTLLMTVITAQVADVPRICVISPNTKPELLAVAHVLGIKEFYRIGGAQAIAALAYGTASISRVDKIVGPGNAYMTAAKKLVAFDCAIDMLAGPTETVIVSHRGNVRYIAADLVAQAEHDPDCLSVLITRSAKLAAGVFDELQVLAANNCIAQQALANNGCILVAGSRDQAMQWANELAPEHITVDERDVKRVRHAGSVFVGDYSAQAAGDYASGPNHVLPTGGAARFRGGLSVLDFVKIITVQKLSRAGLDRIAPTISALAEVEGLEAHAESIRLRCTHA